jgi:2-polyprenyl-6-methoxyphenol hydroxylase-like FAD-dependent oxidoreductase
MIMKQFTSETKKNSRASQAIVIGGGIAGLSTARVLAKFFDQVTVIDRDMLPEAPAFRSGVPQAYHAHTLLPFGQMILDHLFPGLVDQLLKEGANTINAENETIYYEQGIWRKPSLQASRAAVSCSRPMLENVLYRRIQEIPQITVLQGDEVVELVADESRKRVVGITVRNRQLPSSSTRFLPADLVVDASGQNSKAPQWLENLGFTPPEEWRIDAHAGYASRIYQQPQGFKRDWKKLYIGPRPPDGLRGGVIIPLEGDRWHVTLIGLAGDYPPTDEAGFLAFARSLPTSDLYEAILSAKPLSRITGFRKNENRVRRYDHLPRYLEGLLVIGDAAYTMNPIYSLGMTAAVISCQVLETQLKQATSTREGFASMFQKVLAAKISTLWHQAVEGDWKWPETQISDNTEVLYPSIG